MSIDPGAHPDDRPALPPALVGGASPDSPALAPESAQALRERAEAAFQARASQRTERFAAPSPEAVRHVLHELQVHQIELEMQNEELRRAQLELEASRARYFDLYDLAPVGYCSVSEAGLILQANLTVATLLGRARGALVGQPISSIVSKEDQDLYYLLCKRLLDGGQPQASELRLSRRDGSVFWAHLDATVVPAVAEAASEAGTRVLRIVLSDVTRHRQDAEEIRRLAFYDMLTGLPNRRLLMDRLGQAAASAARTGQHGGLLFLDLDHFKQLNDKLGHSAGDLLLLQVARRLQGRLREGDSVARLGGDEFVVLLQGLSPHEQTAAGQADAIARKILEVLRLPYGLRGQSVVCTPSIGITLFAHDHETLDDLLRKADGAMYRAKAAGRNEIRFFDPSLQASIPAPADDAAGAAAADDTDGSTP